MAWRIDLDDKARKQLAKIGKASAARIVAYLGQRISPLDDLRQQGSALHAPAHHETGTGLAFDEIALTFDDMRLLIRTLLVLAALAYGAMPLTGMAGAMPAGADAVIASAVVEPATSPHAMHGHAMQSEAKMIPDAAQAEADCPHPGKTDRMPHCATCLTLPADLRIAASGSPPRAAEAPSVTVAFSSWPAAPLDPPPRV